MYKFRNIKKLSIFILLIAASPSFASTTGALAGKIVDKTTGETLPGANISIVGTIIGAASDEDGNFYLSGIPVGKYRVQIQYIGYQTKEINVDITEAETITLNIRLAAKVLSTETVVVTATRTERARKEAPVIVNVLDKFVFENTQSLSLAESIGFQPGVRLEVDCQTCNYTQIRMNGLGGSYSQILIDSRPVFSPLNGLYGLDYIPTNMIERVETIRGGGSALFGSSAIAGVVNVITKEAEENRFNIGFTNASIDGSVPDRTLTLNSSVLNETRDLGAHFFGMMRDRNAYDNNSDGFSEIPRMTINSFGLRSFYKPTPLRKIILEAHVINEQRQGGNRTDSPPHEADQAEYREHQVVGGAVNFEQYLTANLHKLSAYISGQFTDRNHYTGLDQDLDAYGTTENITVVSGVQYSHNLTDFLGYSSNTITVGVEGAYDDVDDHIPGFGVRTDQITHQVGVFAQSDWQITSRLSTLLGLRMDMHNLLDQPVLNPRGTLLYAITENLQWRGSVSTGFRAPQAFDADLHIAFAGGGISRIRLSDDLEKEQSLSYSTSLDFNVSHNEYYIGFTLGGFYTRLNDAFILEEAEIDANDNMILERRNGGNSTVRGISGEVRLNLSKRLQLGASLTVQKSTYEQPVYWSMNAPPSTNFLRTPDVYGSFSADFNATDAFKLSLSGISTGSMDIPHLAGYIVQDVLERSESFMEINFKAAYRFGMLSTSGITPFAGIQNIFNQYQDDFDKFKDRDSNYIYGPARPRTVFVGMDLSL